MFEWFKKLFGKKPKAVTTETITIQVADEVSLIESTPVEVEVEVTKKKSAPKTPKEKIKVKKYIVCETCSGNGSSCVFCNKKPRYFSIAGRILSTKNQQKSVFSLLR